MSNTREPRSPLELLKTLWEMEESSQGNWYWILQERYQNVRGTKVHEDIGHHQFTKATTRLEIIRFYEKLYSGLLDHAQRLERERNDLLSQARVDEQKIQRLEEQRDRAESGYEKSSKRFEVLMNLLSEAHEEDEMEVPF